jgi:TnpA family transposase
LAQAAYDLMPRIKITDLLVEVDRWTGFSECFTHHRSGRAADDRPALLTAVLADGINLGLTRMSEACRGATLRQLAWIHDWHVREECYAAALARIIDAHRALPLAWAWGDGSTSSSDGQFFRAGGRGEALGDINARHGNEPGVAFYTHISDQFGPFHTKFIAATASKAPHVLDGLLQHQTGLQIAEHYTDTGGATDQVFGMLTLLGYRFAPRLRDLKDRKFYAFRGQAVPEALSGMVDGTVDADHLAAHWDEAVRLAVSVGSGHASASRMLRRLSAYPRQNGLVVALREIGRIERTLFTLDWIRDPVLRRRANAGLNKGEARNALARAIFFHRLGELRDRSFENQIYRASGLNLLVAAVILWNTRYLQSAFDTLGQKGQRAGTRSAASCCAARLGAHQPHRRFHLNRRRAAGSGPPQAAAREALAAGRLSSRPVRANRTIRALSCRDPPYGMTIFRPDAQVGFAHHSAAKRRRAWYCMQSGAISSSSIRLPSGSSNQA